MFRLILRSALMIASGSLLSAAVGIDLHQTRRSANFFVHDLRDARSGAAMAGGGEDERIELGLDVLAVSAERVRRAVFKFLGTSSRGASSVHLILRERSKVPVEIQIAPLFYGNAWQYRVEVPDSMSREALLRGLIEVVLVEFANRGNGPKSAEIPRWLKEGLAFHLLNSVGPELVMSSVERGSMLQSIRRLFGADPLEEARAILRPGGNASVSDLSYPSSGQFAGENFKKYQAAAQLFLLELIRLPAGDKCLVRMIRDLPNFWNWESAFLRGFSPHFQSMLDVEKWWAVTQVSFTGRDPSQVWSPAICLQQLDEILLPATQLRWSTSALPVRGHATLQQVLSEWDFPLQREVLWQTIRRLTALRTYCPPGFDLRLTSAATVGRLDAYGRSLVVVGLVNGGLHFRVFDPNGRKVVDLSESEMPQENAGALAQLKQFLERVPAVSSFSPRETQEVLDQVFSIVGYRRPLEIIPFVDAFRSSLLRYLDRRASLTAAPSNKLYAAPSSEKVIGETINELDELYRWREALHREYSSIPLAGLIDR